MVTSAGSWVGQLRECMSVAADGKKDEARGGGEVRASSLS